MGLLRIFKAAKNMIKSIEARTYPHTASSSEQVEQLLRTHPWRSHYAFESQRRSAFPLTLAERLCAWVRKASGWDREESPSRSLLRPHAVYLSEAGYPVSAVGPADATNGVFVPIARRSARLGHDWDFNPGDLAWVFNFRECGDVRADLVSLVRKPLNPITVWLKSR